jgi:enoyl-CoA hydratase/carnithine racemase
MPTIALLNGHTFAGALMVAMMHDYRIMNPHKGFLCLNELVLGMPLRPPMCSVFREKVGAATFRKMILEAARFKVSFLVVAWVQMSACGLGHEMMGPQP